MVIANDAIEIKKVKLGFRLVKKYEDVLVTYLIKLIDIKEIRVREATTFVKGYILIIPKSEVEVGNNFFYERSHKHTIDIESKQKNKEAIVFKKTIEEFLRG